MAAKLNAYSDNQIIELLDSNSETDGKLDAPASKLQTRRNSKSQNNKKVASDTGSDEENIFDGVKYVLPKKNGFRDEKVSLRIKLRRSTEQSLYKIDTDSECERPVRKFRNTKIRAMRQRKESYSELESEGSYDGKRNPMKIMARDETEMTQSSDGNEIITRSRVRRPPLRLSAYHCGGLSSLNYSTNSPENSLPSLRNKKSINYNEDRLLINSLVTNIKATRQARKEKENKEIDSTPKKNAENKSVDSNVKNNKRNHVAPLKDTENDSGTDSKVTKAKSMRKSKKSESNSYDRLTPTSETKEVTKKQNLLTPTSENITVKADRQKRTSSESVQKIVQPVTNNKDNSKEESLADSYKRIKISSTAGNATPVRSQRQKRITSERTPKTVRIVTNNKTDSEEEDLSDTCTRIKISSAKKNISTPQRRSIVQRKIELQLEETHLSTPKSRTLKCSALIPSVGKRSNALLKPATPLQEARSRLHVSAVPKSLPCREEEFNNIFTFLKGKLEDKSGGCIYISGVPGTGKTATVNEAVRCLQKLIVKGQLDNFDYVAINGMKLTEPRQSYVQILKQLDGRTATWEQAYRILDKRFHTANSKMTLLLVDELDFLCTKRQDVVYNLLDWPTKATAQLVVITIANTMDLPERVLMGRVTSRLGLTRLTFQPYNYKQLQEIVMSRLKDFNGFRSEAIQLVSRKVSAVSGDARRALDICRRAMEIAESRNAEMISLQDVTEAVTDMIASAKVQAIKHCSKMEQIFLQAISSEVTRTSIEEVYFKDAYRQLESLCSFDGIKVPTVTEALAVCGGLGASRLLICDHSRNDMFQKILLNVSADDIHYATQELDLNSDQ